MAFTGVPGPTLTVETFADLSANHGRGARTGLVANASKVGWSWYSRYPASIYFTLPQQDAMNLRITRGLSHGRVGFFDPADDYSATVWTGRFADSDESQDDVIWTAWSYLAELALYRTGYSVKYPSKRIGSEVVRPEWERDDASGKFANYGAQKQVHSLLEHVSTGTIQNPLDTAGVNGMLTDPKFGVILVPRLLLFYDLSEIGRANTDNNVTFEITRDSTPLFNFWRNKGTQVPGRVLTYPADIVAFRWVRGILDIRNDLATVGTKGGSSTQITATRTTGTYGIDAFGLRQDTFTIRTLSGYPNLTKTEAQEDAQTKITKRAVKEAATLTKNLAVKLRYGVMRPFDGWEIEDTIEVDIVTDSSTIQGLFRIVGVTGQMDAQGYSQTMYLAPPAV